MLKVIHGDCLEAMVDIAPGSIDMILTDPPYGTTACKWDKVIPFDPMWDLVWKVLKPNGACVLFGSEPFSSSLRVSQINYFKYDWIWKKDKATGHLNCKIQPMRQTENISVFYRKQCKYIPQYFPKDEKNIRPETTQRKNTDVYGVMDKYSSRKIPINIGYPKNIIEFNSCVENGDKGLCPTQKPVALLEYLIKTYTNEGDTVLDFTMGSGSTGVACYKTNRNFIGIEKDINYFNIARKRVIG